VMITFKAVRSRPVRITPALRQTQLAQPSRVSGRWRPTRSKLWILGIRACARLGFGLMSTATIYEAFDNITPPTGNYYGPARDQRWFLASSWPQSSRTDASSTPFCPTAEALGRFSKKSRGIAYYTVAPTDTNLSLYIYCMADNPPRIIEQPLE